MILRGTVTRVAEDDGRELVTVEIHGWLNRMPVKAEYVEPDPEG